MTNTITFGKPTGPITPSIDQLVDAIHPWINNEVSREQIKSVVWAIYRGVSLDELTAYLNAEAAAELKSMEEVAQAEVDHQVNFHYHRIGHD